MKKILFIHHAAGWGGAPNSLIKLIQQLDTREYQAEVLLLKESTIAEKLAANGIRYSIAESWFYKRFYSFFAHSEAGYVHWYQIITFTKLSILWLLSRFYFAGNELAKHDFDIVHLNSSVLTDWLYPSGTRSKVVIHFREPFRKGKLDLLHHFFKQVIKKNADAVIAISKDNARRLGLPEKTKVIYNFSDVPDRLPPEDSYYSKTMLYLGGSSTSKGFYTLVDALDFLDKDVKIIFAGHYASDANAGSFLRRILSHVIPTWRIRLKALAKVKCHPNAIFKGLIYDTTKYYNLSCGMISPYLVPHFSRPVIEAHLHAKTAIGTDVEGMDEIIENEENGIIVPRNNPRALASAINRLASDGVLSRNLGISGYHTAIQKFTSSNISHVVQVYDHLQPKI